MWDEEDGFYYDLLRLPAGSATRLKVRSMVGLLPLCATTVIEKWQRERVPLAMAGTVNACAGYPNCGSQCTPPARVTFAWGTRNHSPSQTGAAPQDTHEDAR